MHELPMTSHKGSIKLSVCVRTVFLKYLRAYPHIRGPCSLSTIATHYAMHHDDKFHPQTQQLSGRTVGCSLCSMLLQYVLPHTFFSCPLHTHSCSFLSCQFMPACELVLAPAHCVPQDPHTLQRKSFTVEDRGMLDDATRHYALNLVTEVMK